ncbi:hypothetical protein [Alteromonas sp. M12]|uniref:DUF7065 domain-containing protein n=1 Tax=Alteromonas sp. M12 TaxID=3135644 RepID=UPI00319DE68D
MEVVGGGTALEYGPEEEGPHEVGSHEFWQESVVLFWWDEENSVGGMHRIGHEPNTKNGPQVNLWNHIFSPDYIFKRDDTIPLRPQDKFKNGFNCGDDTCIFEYTDHAVWTINEPEIQAELHVYDQHTPVDIYPKKGSLAEDVAPNHMEVASKVSGSLTIKSKVHVINGLAFRDHGWGIRKWDAFVSHRWVAGVGENFSFLAQTFHSSDDDLVRFGCFIQDNTLTYAKDVEVITYLEADGLTNRGGQVVMTLTTNEILTIDCTPLQKGAVSWIHGIACVDTLCKFKVGTREGVCDFEVTNNALRGSIQPRLAINGIVNKGLNRI